MVTAEGAVASPVSSVLIKNQNWWTEQTYKIKYVCPINMEAFVKEREVWQQSDAGLGFSQFDLNDLPSLPAAFLVFPPCHLHILSFYVCK